MKKGDKNLQKNINTNRSKTNQTIYRKQQSNPKGLYLGYWSKTLTLQPNLPNESSNPQPQKNRLHTQSSSQIQ